jgi:hypothetical protein
MKKLLLFVLLGVFVTALFALDTPYANGAFARKTPTPTPKATRVRKPKATATPKRAATPKPTATAEPSPTIDNADAENAEVVPAPPGAMTSQIVVFNPDTSGSATVQIDVYDNAGNVAYSTTNTVNANGAKLITLPGSLGANFQGGAVISSDKNVQAIAIAANGNNTARDAYEGTSAPATNIILPFARHLAADSQNSILAIQNTTASSANVTITFYNADGSIANQQNATLAARQPFYLNTNDVFPSSTFVGSVVINSPQNKNIAAALQSHYYKDTTSIRGLGASEQDSLAYLSWVERNLNAKGVPQNWSEIFVRNNGGSPTDITVEFFSAAGTSLGTQTASGVAANGSAQFLLNDPAFAFLGNSFVGWAKISSSGQPLVATALDVLGKGKRLTGLDGLANAQLTTRFICGDTLRSSLQNTQLTILNTEARNAKVIVRLYDPNSGAKLVQTRLKLIPNESRTIKLSDALFAAAGTNFEGMTFVQAKGVNPAKILVSVANPYGSPKQIGTTGYVCTPM